IRPHEPAGGVGRQRVVIEPGPVDQHAHRASPVAEWISIVRFLSSRFRLCRALRLAPADRSDDDLAGRNCRVPSVGPTLARMTPSLTVAQLCSGRVHYAWIVLVVMFTATLA